MTEQISDAAGGVSSQVGGASGLPLGSLTGMMQGGLNNLLNTGSNILDRWFPPAKREELKNKLMKFATERPQLAAFLLSQIALSGIPLALFVLMSITVLVFALLVGIIVGVLGAVLFTVFCLGFALIVLLPTLLMTTFAATFIFLWGLGAYYIIKWFNQKDVPGIHKGGQEQMQKQLGLDNLPALNGEAKEPKKEDSSNGDADAHENGDTGATEKEGKPSPAKPKSPAVSKKSQTPNGKGTGADSGPVGDVKKTAGGAVSGVTSGLGL